MATQYFPLNSKQLALAQSENYWNKVLGRTKLSADVTQYLFQVIECPNSGKAYIVADDATYAYVYPRLSAADQRFLDQNLVPGSDPAVQACLAAIAAALPPT